MIAEPTTAEPRHFEVAFHDKSPNEVVDAVRVEDHEGWLYFYTAEGPWVLRVPAIAVRSIRAGERTRGVTASAPTV